MSNPQPPPEFPPIEPSTFDLIILGTSLPSSILSAASSSVSKTVLHLDPNPFYGSLFSSLPPTSLPSVVSPPVSDNSPSPSSVSDINPIPTRCLAAPISLPLLPPHLSPLSEKFLLDVSGPRVFFCADSAVNLLIKSGISSYLEFKAIDESLVYVRDGEVGRLVSVPDSRAGIFKNTWLSLPEKNKFMKLFRIVERHFRGDDADGKISEKDLEMPFYEFLLKLALPKKIIGIVLYAIALVDYDQENIETCTDLLRTRDGIDRLALYVSSIERFPNANGAMLYPMYGQGELPQAFCRRAAVKGCIYVLRMPVAALLTDEGTGLYKGVRLATGQDIFSQKLIMDPDLMVPQALASSTDKDSERTSTHHGSRKPGKVARAICITKTSLKTDASNLVIVLPPRSLYPEQTSAVRALQLSSNTAVCPASMFVVHLSSLCNDANQGETLLTATMDALFRQPTSEGSNVDSTESPSTNSDAPDGVQEDPRPICEWRTLYIQEITEGSVDTISTSPSPDGNLSYNHVFLTTEKMFQQIFPGEEFFPEQAPPEDVENDEAVDPE